MELLRPLKLKDMLDNWNLTTRLLKYYIEELISICFASHFNKYVWFSDGNDLCDVENIVAMEVEDTVAISSDSDPESQNGTKGIMPCSNIPASWIWSILKLWDMTRACERSGEHSGHISFRAKNAFLKITLRSLNTLHAARSTQNALW